MCMCLCVCLCGCVCLSVCNCVFVCYFYIFVLPQCCWHPPPPSPANLQAHQTTLIWPAHLACMRPPYQQLYNKVNTLLPERYLLGTDLFFIPPLMKHRGGGATGCHTSHSSCVLFFFTGCAHTQDWGGGIAWGCHMSQTRCLRKSGDRGNLVVFFSLPRSSSVSVPHREPVPRPPEVPHHPGAHLRSRHHQDRLHVPRPNQRGMPHLFAPVYSMPHRIVLKTGLSYQYLSCI